jgi:hypothetical protein
MLVVVGFCYLALVLLGLAVVRLSKLAPASFGLIIAGLRELAPVLVGVREQSFVLCSPRGLTLRGF